MENDIELSPQDIAMQAFLTRFPVPLTRVRISDDGKKMTYRLRGSKSVGQYLQVARWTIIGFNLPLKAERSTFQIGDFIIEDNIEIDYSPASEPLPCY